VNSLRQYVHIFYETAVISLLQPTPETYDLFDDINLLSDSKIVYQGPLENVIEFFEQMGFKCPEKNGVADLLLEVSINLVLLFSTIITIGFLIRNAISMGVKISLGNNE
jgi:ABC-type multidrug transport system ATPase subunit